MIRIDYQPKNKGPVYQYFMHDLSLQAAKKIVAHYLSQGFKAEFSFVDNAEKINWRKDFTSL